MDLVICSTLGSVQIGFYKNSTLIDTLYKEGQISDTLPNIFESLIDKKIENIYFARGPGSFMAIKLTYVFLKTISIMKNINLFGVDSFYFTKNRPIKSIGNSYFIKNNNQIEIQTIKEIEEYEVTMPQQLNKNDFNTNISPLYIVPAVGI